MNTIKFYQKITIILLFGLCATKTLLAAPPYPNSQIIPTMSFDFANRNWSKLATGSDNWPVTWADDGHQYTSWGDGNGFSQGARASLGVARVEGPANNYTGIDIWRSNSSSTVPRDGKSYGIISVDRVLYMWRSPGSDFTGYDEISVYKSTNRGVSWTAPTWRFLKSEGMINPTFLQHGQDYVDGGTYVYVYANHINLSSSSPTLNALGIQKPGEIALMRVPRNRIMDRAAYEFFSGTDSNGNAKWTKILTARVPVFQDPNGVGWVTGGVMYNPGLGRYLLITEFTKSAVGNLGVFEGPTPWGPWRTVYYGNVDTDYKKFTGSTSTTVIVKSFNFNFSSKWLSADGKNFVLVFSGGGSFDSWNSLPGSFGTGTPPPTNPPTTPSGVSIIIN